MIEKGKLVFHERYWSSISEDAKDLLAQMLNVDPDARPQVTMGSAIYFTLYLSHTLFGALPFSCCKLSLGCYLHFLLYSSLASLNPVHACAVCFQAAALLRHKWISAARPALMRSSLEASQIRLKDFNAKKKLKSAVNTVKAVNTMKSVLGTMKATRSGSSFARTPTE